MNEYIKQAKDFLTSCNATMKIEYVGLEIPKWSTHKHRTYDCTITTPKGEMKVHFYDSLHNTELHMPINEYCKKVLHKEYTWLSFSEKTKLQKELKNKKEKAIPTEYDILTCLTKYDVGTMDDFMHEFGYEIHSTQDMFNFLETYNAVIKEYNDIKRCFTEQQIEAMQEIQ